jgi:hypothetical protein
MKLIRSFLWGLVLTMTLQGFLNADEYGAGAGFFGGMSLTMSVWSESVGSGWRSMFGSSSAHVSLPRAIVMAALRETARHPQIQNVPALQAAIRTHEQLWNSIRDREVTWMLRHARIVGGVVADPVGRTLWSHLGSRVGELTTGLVEAEAAVCTVSMGRTGCQTATEEVSRLTSALTQAKAAKDAWASVLDLEHDVDVAAWWNATQGSGGRLVADFQHEMAYLHNIDSVQDMRVASLLNRANVTAEIVSDGDVWLEQLVGSLLEGLLWRSCGSHVRIREGRIRELMILAGIQDMYNAHERVLNVSLRSVSTEGERKLVGDWFTEIGGHAWWLGDDLPEVVRRCVNQEAGDCVRIGPTEIAALSAQLGEQARIVKDWSRRVFIGMWNAMPAVLMLFVMELIVLCITKGPKGQLILTDRVQKEQVDVMPVRPVRRSRRLKKYPLLNDG